MPARSVCRALAVSGPLPLLFDVQWLLINYLTDLSHPLLGRIFKLSLVTAQMNQMLSVLNLLDGIFYQWFWIEHGAVGHALVECFFKPCAGIGIAVCEHDRAGLALDCVVREFIAVGVTT